MTTIYSRSNARTSATNPILELPADQRDAVLAMLYRVVLVKDTPLYHLLVDLEAQVDTNLTDKIISSHKITAHFKVGIATYEVEDFDMVVENGK